MHPTPNPSPYTRLGAKGIAEGNQYTTPVCIANAVADSLGIEDVQLPLNPARVLGWIKDSEPPPSGRSAPEIVTDGKRPTIDGAGEIEVPAPPLKVWDILLDPNQMAKIVPGCEALEVVGENSFRGSLILGVGPVKGRFDARINLTDLDKPNRANLVGSANGVLGSSRGAGSFTLTPTDVGTLVKYSYSVDLSGKIASVGGRLIRGAARHLIDRFMRALVRQAIGDEPEAQPRPTGSGSLWTKIKNVLGGGQ